MGVRFSPLVHTGPGAHAASYAMGNGSFHGVMRPGRGVDHPPPSSAEVKERFELFLLWAFVACSKMTFTFKERYITKRRPLVTAALPTSR